QPLVNSLEQAARLLRLEACNVVRLDPSGRSYGKTPLGASRQLPGGRQIAAVERRLGGGEVRVGEVALAAIGDGQGGVRGGDLRIVRERLAQAGDRLLDQGGIVGGEQRLTEQHVNEGGVRRQRDGVAQRRDRFAGTTGIHQRLSFEFQEIRVVWLRLDQRID